MQSVIDLYLLWDDAPATPVPSPRRSARAVNRRAPRDGAPGWRSRSAAEPGVRSLHVPPAPTGGFEEDRVSAACTR